MNRMRGSEIRRHPRSVSCRRCAEAPSRGDGYDKVVILTIHDGATGRMRAGAAAFGDTSADIESLWWAIRGSHVADRILGRWWQRPRETYSTVTLLARFLG